MQATCFTQWAIDEIDHQINQKTYESVINIMPTFNKSAGSSGTLKTKKISRIYTFKSQRTICQFDKPSFESSKLISWKSCLSLRFNWTQNLLSYYRSIWLPTWNYPSIFVYLVARDGKGSWSVHLHICSFAKMQDQLVQWAFTVIWH